MQFSSYDFPWKKKFLLEVLGSLKWSFFLLFFWDFRQTIQNTLVNLESNTVIFFLMTDLSRL